MELGQRLHMAHLRYVYVESREERSGVAEVVLMTDQIRLDLLTKRDLPSTRALYIFLHSIIM